MVTPRDSRCKLLPVQGAPVVQYLPQLRQLRVPEVAESLPSSIQLPKSCLPQHAQSAWLLMLALSARIRGPRATAAMDVASCQLIARLHEVVFPAAVTGWVVAKLMAMPTGNLALLDQTVQSTSRR